MADLAPQRLPTLRVLDLACLEGQYAVEFARRGATVLAIEGRAAHVAKTLLARDAWGLTRLTVLEDDVRNLHPDQHGTFDAVLCLGILYHLDAPDLFVFMRRVAEVCRGFAVFDTHVSLTKERREVFEGEVYSGRTHTEHPPDSTLEQRLRGPWSSLNNPESFWLTPQSLLRLLAHVGFTSVFECLMPEVPGKTTDRKVWTAFLPKHRPATGENASTSRAVVRNSTSVLNCGTALWLPSPLFPFGCAEASQNNDGLLLV
ncbi:MAG: class I SAM-dependent methyltransferase [Planctomycetaceae bacterium]|nr:class I SAM-dependent methyltransferase [Planctomycetaceae bacterium]